MQPPVIGHRTVAVLDAVTIQQAIFVALAHLFVKVSDSNGGLVFEASFLAVRPQCRCGRMWVVPRWVIALAIDASSE
jgi:hypothetical protein